MSPSSSEGVHPPCCSKGEGYRTPMQYLSLHPCLATVLATPSCRSYSLPSPMPACSLPSLTTCLRTRACPLPAFPPSQPALPVCVYFFVCVCGKGVCRPPGYPQVPTRCIWWLNLKDLTKYAGVHTIDTTPLCSNVMRCEVRDARV